MELFKYRANFERDLTSLQNNQLYAPTYEDLNDPFEGMLDTLQDEKFLKFFNQFGNDNFTKAYEEIKILLKKVGVYSLSKDLKNEILWSLYANGHEGFVIGYDEEKLLKDFNFNKTVPLVHQIKVKYDEKPSALLQIKDIPYNGFNLSNAIGIKSNSWRHENEVRLIFEQNGLNEYNYSAISRIIFGMRTTSENITKTLRFLKGRNYKYQQIISVPNTFELDIKDIEDEFVEDVLYEKECPKFNNELISEKNIGFVNSEITEQLQKTIKMVLQLPNIIEITSIDIDTDREQILLNIFCKHNHKNLEIRFFQFALSDGFFEQIN